MNENPCCAGCGVGLLGQAVGAMCASCLLKLALDPLPEDLPGLEGHDRAPAGPGKGRRFGDYELLNEIARGGMGVVYKAHQVSLNRIVALKMILAGDFSSPAVVERFKTEAEAAARMEHPGIVPIHEIGAHDGQHYFSMRFLEGGTLTQALTSRKFSLRESAELLMAVAEAVHHAHQHGILHRDLKPGNILLDAGGAPLVADFGLAKLLEHESGLTISAAVMGSPAYMAPEQAAGRNRQLTTAADIYSLGAVLYEMLTGSAPFLGATAAETMRRMMESDPDRSPLRKAGADRDLETVCLKCLEKDPARRYGSAEGLARDLERWLGSEPIHARRTTVAGRVLKWSRRKPVVASLAASILVVALAGIGGIFWQAERAGRQAVRATAEAARAREEFRRAENELWNANFNEARALRIAGGTGARLRTSAVVRKLSQRPGLTEDQLLALRAEAIAQMALIDVEMPSIWIPVPSWPLLGWNQHLDRYARDTKSAMVEIYGFPSRQLVASFPLPAGEGTHQTTLSPDGQFLAVHLENGSDEALVWDVATKEVILRSPLLGAMQMSPDSRMIAVSTPQGVNLTSLKKEGGGTHFLRTAHPVLVAVFSPDSKRIALLPDSCDTVEIWDAASGEIQRSFAVKAGACQLAWHPDGVRLMIGGIRGHLEMRTLPAGGKHGPSDAGMDFRGHVATIFSITFTPDGTMVISHSFDQSSIVWDLVSCRPLLREHRMSVLGINPEGDKLQVRKEHPIQISESVAPLLTRTGYRTEVCVGEVRQAHAVFTSPDGRLGVVSYESAIPDHEGDCILWVFRTGAEAARIKGVWAQFSADSRTLFTFERYPANRVRSYDVGPEALADPPPDWSQGKVIYQGLPEEAVNTGTMSADGRTLVIAATDAVIFLDTVTGKTIRTLKKPAHAVTLSSDGKWLGTSRHHHRSVLRTAENGEAAIRFEFGTRVIFNPDARWMALSTGGEVRVHKMELPLQIAYPAIRLGGETALNPALEFSPDSRIFA
ncbi:MAG: hypothetical protein EOP86_05100, partial [Verrucomicrobiaceae bacterium]